MQRFGSVLLQMTGERTLKVEIFPELVDQVNHFRYLMQEGFRIPPKWQNIYRYQLMHEL